LQRSDRDAVALRAIEGFPGRSAESARLHLQRIAADEAEPLAREVETWITQHLGRNYPWPGNFRELEQCVRNVLIRKQYNPPKAPASVSGDDLNTLMGIRGNFC